VFSVRYGLNLYTLFRSNESSKGSQIRQAVKCGHESRGTVLARTSSNLVSLLVVTKSGLRQL
jgi:hypothetical protein